MEGGVVESPEVSQQLRVGCACGWEVVGTADVVVPAVLDHGEQVHNMKGTREDVLANAERIDASGTDPGRPDSQSASSGF
jgi:predicted small metal-binding protein